MGGPYGSGKAAAARLGGGGGCGNDVYCFNSAANMSARRPPNDLPLLPASELVAGRRRQVRSGVVQLLARRSMQRLGAAEGTHGQR